MVLGSGGGADVTPGAIPTPTETVRVVATEVAPTRTRGPDTPTPYPTPIVVERIIRVPQDPFPCVVIRLDATLSVADQLAAAHDFAIDMICDPDSMVVPRTRLIDP